MISGQHNPTAVLNWSTEKMKYENEAYNNERGIQFYIDNDRTIAKRRLNLSL